MTKYTQEQLLAMTNEQKDEIVALAQGWTIKELQGLSERYHDHDGYICHVSHYRPSTNKEQAWDLMVKCKLDFLSSYHRSTNEHMVIRDILYDEMIIVEHKDPLIAVVIASILHLQESE